MKSPAFLYGSRVLLRPIGEADIARLYEITLKPEVIRLTGSRTFLPFEQARDWYRRMANEPDRADFAVVLRENDLVIGEAVLNQIDTDNQLANFRMFLDTDGYVGKGYGTETTRLLTDFGFDTLKLHRIELSVYAFNTRAIRAYEKAGFVHEGVRRKALYWDGRYHDEIEMGLLSSDRDGSSESAP